MIERLTGAEAVSARQLSSETGISQETLSRWLREARSFPEVPSKKPKKTWSIDEKIRVLSDASKLSGRQLSALLEREGLLLAELEQWRLALGDHDRATIATTKRMRKLERELARKEKALAEAAALLVLKKKVEHLCAENLARCDRHWFPRASVLWLDGQRFRWDQCAPAVCSVHDGTTLLD